VRWIPNHLVMKVHRSLEPHQPHWDLKRASNNLFTAACDGKTPDQRDLLYESTSNTLGQALWVERLTAGVVPSETTADEIDGAHSMAPGGNDGGNDSKDMF